MSVFETEVFCCRNWICLFDSVQLIFSFYQQKYSAYDNKLGKFRFFERNDSGRNPVRTHSISVQVKATFWWRKTSVKYNERIKTVFMTKFYEIKFSCMTRCFTLNYVPFLCRNLNIRNSVLKPDFFIIWFFCRKFFQKTEILRWTL